MKSVLLSPTALASAALIVVNDAWLKRSHAGFLSGKLSDVGLSVLLPLVVLAVLEELPALRRAAHRHLLACGIALGYFVLVKCVPAATHLHVAALSALVPGVRFRAVTDPTDLVCLPAALLAVRAMRARSAAQPVSSASTRSIFSRLGGFAMWRANPASAACARSSGRAYPLTATSGTPASDGSARNARATS